MKIRKPIEAQIDWRLTEKLQVITSFLIAVEFTVMTILVTFYTLNMNLNMNLNGYDKYDAEGREICFILIVISVILLIISLFLWVNAFHNRLSANIMTLLLTSLLVSILSMNLFLIFNLPLFILSAIQLILCIYHSYLIKSSDSF